MNLYIFNETRRGAIYGIGTYIRELTASLKSHDIHICVINLFSEKPQIQIEETGNLRHWYFPVPLEEQRTSDVLKQRALYFRNIAYLLQLYIKDKKDLIFHLNYPHNKNLIEELKKAFECRVISVIHFSKWGAVVFDNLQRLRSILSKKHPNDSFDEDLKKSFEEEKTDYSKSDHVVCLSNYMQQILCQDYGLDATKVSVIPNGLKDNGEWQIEHRKLFDKDALRTKWNIPHGEKIILFAGRIDEMKGVSYLIKAFRKVLKTDPNCRMIIAGSGDYDICLQEARDICTKITFTGLLEKEELYELYEIADIGVTPSLFEPFGYVAVEMMMHKLPIVATATSGLDEVINDTCGLKIPIIKYSDKIEIDTDLLAKKIRYLLLHPKEARKLGENGCKRYKKMYSSKVFGRKMFQFYQSLIKE